MQQISMMVTNQQQKYMKRIQNYPNPRKTFWKKQKLKLLYIKTQQTENITNQQINKERKLLHQRRRFQDRLIRQGLEFDFDLFQNRLHVTIYNIKLDNNITFTT